MPSKSPSAFAESCPISHGFASVKSQEEAYGIEAPKNAQLIRNIMMAGDFIQNNITHFYHLSALDFVDVPGVLAYSGNDSLMLGIKSWVQEELKSNKLQPGAPFLPRFEGKYLQQSEGNLTTVRNYFTALDIRAKGTPVGCNILRKIASYGDHRPRWCD